MIKIGSLNIDKMYLGTNDVKVYLGSIKIYPSEEPTYQGFCKLTLNDSSVVELEGSGELTQSMISSYRSTLVSAEIGTLCTSIGNRVFYECLALTSATISNSVTSISQWAFRSCTSLTSVTIPNSVTSIGDGAFSWSSGLTSVTIGSGVTSISESAFVNCTSLTSITISDSVTSISNYAFASCSSLKSIDIPSGVTSIGERVFVNCTSLTSITVESATPPTLGSNDVFENTHTNLVIYVPSTSVDAYKSATRWSNYASRIQAIQ